MYTKTPKNVNFLLIYLKIDTILLTSNKKIL